MRVINCTQSVVGIHGITIPAGQHRNVRGFDPDNERNQELIADGSIQVPALDQDSYLSTDHGLLAELDESEIGEYEATDDQKESALKRARAYVDSVKPNSGTDEPNPGISGWFKG